MFLILMEPFTANSNSTVKTKPQLFTFDAMARNICVAWAHLDSPMTNMPQCWSNSTSLSHALHRVLINLRYSAFKREDLVGTLGTSPILLNCT